MDVKDIKSYINAFTYNARYIQLLRFVFPEGEHVLLLPHGTETCQSSERTPRHSKGSCFPFLD
jgi:hypothetical protein